MSVDILSHFSNVKKLGGNNQYLCRCSSHDDKSASLTVKIIDDKILVHCFAGCTPEDIVSSVGLTINDLFNDSVDRKVIHTAKKKVDGKKQFRLDYLAWWLRCNRPMIDFTIEDKKYYNEVQKRLSQVKGDIHAIYKSLAKEQEFDKAHKNFKAMRELELTQNPLIKMR